MSLTGQFAVNVSTATTGTPHFFDKPRQNIGWVVLNNGGAASYNMYGTMDNTNWFLLGNVPTSSYTYPVGTTSVPVTGVRGDITSMSTGSTATLQFAVAD